MGRRWQVGEGEATNHPRGMQAGSVEGAGVGASEGGTRREVDPPGRDQSEGKWVVKIGVELLQRGLSALDIAPAD